MTPKFFKLLIRDDEEILGLTIWKPVIDKLLQHLGMSQQDTARFPGKPADESAFGLSPQSEK